MPKTRAVTGLLWYNSGHDSVRELIFPLQYMTLPFPCSLTGERDFYGTCPCLDWQTEFFKMKKG